MSWIAGTRSLGDGHGYGDGDGNGDGDGDEDGDLMRRQSREAKRRTMFGVVIRGQRFTYGEENQAYSRVSGADKDSRS